jgi:pyrroline-5-carboxylate reductase
MIGAGNMATALARGWISAGLLQPTQIRVFDIDSTRLEILVSAGISRADDNRDLARNSDLILLATKPQAVLPAMEEIRADLPAKTLIVSIAAGITLASLEGAVPPGTPVVRVMPNTPCLVGAGASAFSLGRSADSTHGEMVGQLFNAVGCAVHTQESLMDAVTGLSGSGPAYAFITIEALADGGVRAGLDRATALKLAAQTMLGAAKMVLDTGEHPGKLKDQVASPAGTTIAGLAVLEARSIRSAFMDAVAAATARSAELSRRS